jgi:hypothetical protein
VGTLGTPKTGFVDDMIAPPSFVWMPSND